MGVVGVEEHVVKLAMIGEEVAGAVDTGAGVAIGVGLSERARRSEIFAFSPCQIFVREFWAF